MKKYIIFVVLSLLVLQVTWGEPFDSIASRQDINRILGITSGRRVLDAEVLKQLEPYLASNNSDISGYAFLRLANAVKNVENDLLRKKVVLTLVKHIKQGEELGIHASALQRMHSSDFSNEARRILDELYADFLPNGRPIER